MTGYSKVSTKLARSTAIAAAIVAWAGIAEAQLRAVWIVLGARRES